MALIPGSSDSREVGRALAMSQVGFEMVGPIILGLVLDHYLGWTPWGLVVGAVLGLFGGLYHLVQILNKDDAPSAPQEGPKGTNAP
jgi:F0F1-type ATP synthase assembly protein I